MSEFDAAYEILDNITHQVLECEDALLTAQCFSCLADAKVGLAGELEGERRSETLHKALEFLGRSGAGWTLPVAANFPIADALHVYS